MRRFSTLVTILITSFVMALAGLVASPIASANENDGSISATFAVGSSVLSDDQKAAIKKALESSGSDATFIVTGTAGKLPGVSDSKVMRLAKKRAQAIKAYLVSLGVSKTSVATQTKMTEIGETPKSIGRYPTPAPNPTVTAVATNNAPALTCATGGTCIVGDAGPGGGIVYYVNTAGFACGPTLAIACNYLEVAPSGWSGANTQDLVWAATANRAADVSGIANDSSAYNNALGIGLGYKNSVAIVNQGNGVTTTAGAARAYAGGSKNDWYLPTTAELNLLCQWNRGVSPAVGTACTGGTANSPTYGAGSAGFVGYAYWSSSEHSASKAWFQFFNDGLQMNYDKNTSTYVRPVRAFAPDGPTCANGGTCVMGNTGPGGGIVYYVNTAGFACGPTLAAICKYLEVAPSGWSGGGTDPNKAWAVLAYQSADVTDITNDSSPYNNASGIGLGYKNSVAIVNQGNNTTTAAGAARAYAGGSKNDWYLPTTAELNLLCQWNYNVTQDVTIVCTGGTLNTGTGATGSGFSTFYYWSSSEYDNYSSNFQIFGGSAQSFIAKSYDFIVKVRPVRAF